MRYCLIVALMLLAGCTIEQGGVAKHVVIGFGVVTVPKTNVVAQVTKVTAIGFYGGPGNFYLGAGSLLTTTVQTNANVILEIK